MSLIGWCSPAGLYKAVVGSRKGGSIISFREASNNLFALQQCSESEPCLCAHIKLRLGIGECYDHSIPATARGQGCGFTALAEQWENALTPQPHPESRGV